MISRLIGKVIHNKQPIVLEINGIGYDVCVPSSYLFQINQKVTLFTHLLIKKDTQVLFGFDNEDELYLFRKLIKVNGIGTKLALSVLSKMSIDQFFDAIENKETSKFLALPGIGKKIIERLFIKIKQKSKKNNNNEKKEKFLKNKKNPVIEEAIAGLIYLGYKYKEATDMIKKINNSNSLQKNDCKSLIYEALKFSI